MLDIQLIRKDYKAVEAKLRKKDPSIDLSTVYELDLRRRELQTKGQALKAQRNEISQKIGEYKRTGKSVEELLAEVAKHGETIAQLDLEFQTIEKEFEQEFFKLPNLPMDDIKVSQDPKDNEVIKIVGAKPHFNFPFKNHVELNEKLHHFDFKRGAKLAGAGWPIYRHLGARLEWALINYMMDLQLKNGFMHHMTPLVVRDEISFGAGQLPKFEHQQFKLAEATHTFYLIPTAEVALNGMHFDEILAEESLPLKYMAYTPCFRREAGAAGSQERGLIRTHQFNKVEMFCFTKPEDSMTTFNWMMGCAEQVLEGLGLHYRSTLLVTGDMSYGAARTVDIEVWLPGQDRYYEVSSVSNCTDFQARRSGIRFRRSVDDKPEFVHTLNGSGVATSRLMVALLENNQHEDGSINIPEVLHKYLDGITRLTPM
ncbi:MAG: serine--tRNA ligase [Parachlamydiaceae bacterium]